MSLTQAIFNIYENKNNNIFWISSLSWVHMYQIVTTRTLSCKHYRKDLFWISAISKQTTEVEWWHHFSCLLKPLKGNLWSVKYLLVLRSLITSPIIKNCYGLLLCNICSNPKNSKICVFAFFDLRKWVKKGELFQKAGEKAEVQ